MPKPEHPSEDSVLHIGGRVHVNRSDLRFTFARSSGPGGQAVNKISTKALLRLPISAIHGLDDDAISRLRRLAGRRVTQDDDVLIASEAHRSQVANKEACIERLRELVASAAVKPKIRKKKKPTRGMIERRLKAKRQSSEKKSLRRSRKTRSDMD